MLMVMFFRLVNLLLFVVAAFFYGVGSRSFVCLILL